MKQFQFVVLNVVGANQIGPTFWLGLQQEVNGADEYQGTTKEDAGNAPWENEMAEKQLVKIRRRRKNALQV